MSEVIDLKREKIRKQVKELVRDNTFYRYLSEEQLELMVEELYSNEHGDEVVILKPRRRWDDE